MQEAKRILEKYWGYSEFRDAQARVIKAIFEQKDTLAVMPTGAGKSICFQVPALCFEGITLVVSPLIALMQDQVQSLKSKGIKAEALYSGMKHKSIDRILDNCIYGDVKLLYVSPERLKSDLFIERFKKMNVPLIAVDEAHCISQWGFDFRPSYLEIKDIYQHKPDAKILALTATAPPNVEGDICQSLQINPEHVLKFDLSRPNLHFLLIDAEEKEHQMASLMTKSAGDAVIYCRRRSLTVETADFLNHRGINCLPYHAGMKSSLRQRNQEKFMSGEVRAIAATTAFGMGVDKSNVRYVYHLQLPSSPEEYFQEAGRAGRDGKDSFCVMIYNSEDIPELKGRIERLFPPIKMITRIFNSLMAYHKIGIGSGEFQTFDFDPELFCEHYSYKRSIVFNSLFYIEKAGYLTISEGVRNGSLMRIVMHRDDLYSQQVRNKKLNKFMQYLLRNYEGLFLDFVKIYESKIAKDLNTSDVEIKKYLKKLDSQDIIDYLPRTDKAQITLIRPRPHPSHFEIDKKHYDFLKERAEYRMQAMIRLLTTDQCRMKVMMEYFGQEMVEKCGKCDICLGSHQVEASDTVRKKIHSVVMELLKENREIKVQDVVDYFPIIFRNRVIHYLDNMEDNNVLEIFDRNKIRQL